MHPCKMILEFCFKRYSVCFLGSCLGSPTVSLNWLPIFWRKRLAFLFPTCKAGQFARALIQIREAHSGGPIALYMMVTWELSSARSTWHLSCGNYLLPKPFLLCRIRSLEVTNRLLVECICVIKGTHSLELKPCRTWYNPLRWYLMGHPEVKSWIWPDAWMPGK